MVNSFAIALNFFLEIFPEGVCGKLDKNFIPPRSL